MRDKLNELLAPVVNSLGYELWELEFVQRGDGGLLRLYIDVSPADVRVRPIEVEVSDLGIEEAEMSEGGISVEDCARTSRAVSEVLDEADPIPGHFTLEVSSPGMDRVLRTRRHFERFVGERANVEMKEALSGRRKFLGRITAVDEARVTLEIGPGTTEAVQLPLAGIHKARLAPEF